MVHHYLILALEFVKKILGGEHETNNDSVDVKTISGSNNNVSSGKKSINIHDVGTVNIFYNTPSQKTEQKEEIVEQVGVTTSNENSEKVLYLEGKRQLIINADKLTDSEKEELSKILIERKTERDKAIFRAEDLEIFDELASYNSSQNKRADDALLEYFKDKIPEYDLDALANSLFLRSQSKKGKNIVHLKQQISQRFGMRGNNIANLCNADYFEKFIYPLYSYTERKKADSIYELVIKNAVLAIFVNSNMSIDDLEDEVKQKIISSYTYEFPGFFIHGINPTNVKTIKEWVEKNKESGELLIETIYDTSEIMVVRILLHGFKYNNKH